MHASVCCVIVLGNASVPACSPHPPPPCRHCRLQRSEEIAAEKNRALKAALNAELRKTKATLLEQAIPLLEKMARKGKGLTPERIAARQAQVRPAECCAAVRHQTAQQQYAAAAVEF